MNFQAVKYMRNGISFVVLEEYRIIKDEVGLKNYNKNIRNIFGRELLG